LITYVSFDRISLKERKMDITNCCSAPFVGEGTICSDCNEHADILEKEDCCKSKQNGFKCTCIKTSYAYTQQAEDDGQGDYDRDQALDEKAWEETQNMRSHNDFEED
jgi:hypothetical protein